MSPLRTLRGRLAGAMLAILLVALITSAVFNRLHRPAAADALVDEPYQDGLVLGAFSIAALALIWAVSSWSLRPLARASQEARAVGPLHPGARLSRDRLPAEIVPLVDAVNGALNRMADAVEAERRFTENAAHELRTPLAVLALRLQRARQAGGVGQADWPVIERDVAAMTRLVNQMLDLARKENPGHAREQKTTLNIARVAREAAAMVLPLAEAQGRELIVDLPETLTVRGHADDLRDALRNLLENAAQHGRGRITLHGAAEQAGVALVVTDEGPGVPAGTEEAMFERFRKDPRSTGTGLGLAIVREVVRAHGGRVEFVAGGRGCVRVWVPT